jgi:LCP family protein required for cell wall assembly
MTTEPPLPPELDPRRGQHADRSARRRSGRPAPAGVSSRFGVPPGAAAPSGLSRFGRALSWVALSTAVVLLLLSGTVFGYLRYVDSQLNHVAISNCSSGVCYKRPVDVGKSENFLLVGSDTRAGDNSTGNLAGLANGSGGYGQSDTTMLVHLSAGTGKVWAVSFPRDMLVTMPAHKNANGTVMPATQAKFNAAYAAGGPSLLVEQVEELTGIHVDHYVGIDFFGFESVVDALGGVNVCISPVPGNQNLRDPGIPGVSGGSGFVGHDGINYLNGAKALEYVRQRDGLPNNDLDRIKRQQRLLGAIFRKVKSAGTLLNPGRINSLVTAAVSNLKVDSKTHTQDLVTLASGLRSLDPGHIEFFTVPTVTENGLYLPYYGAGQDVQLPVAAGAHQLFQDVHDDIDPATPAAARPKPKPEPSASPSASASTTPLTLAPSSVSVSVENGSGVSMQGTQAATDLRGVGFSVSGITDAAVSGQTQTLVRYGTGRADSARTLAAAVPGSVLQADPTLGSQQLILETGTNYTGAQHVAIGDPGPVLPSGAAAPASASSSASPSAAATTPPPAPATPTATGLTGCGP